jgi:hypothetical protein
MPRTSKKANPADDREDQATEIQFRKHEHLAFRKIVLLAAERMGKATNRMNRERTHHENLRGVADATGINRTSIAYIKKHPKDGGTQTPAIETFQRMALWLEKLDPPLKDENGLVIRYNYLELIDLNEKAKAIGDAGDLFVEPAKVEVEVKPEPVVEIEDKDDFFDDDEDDTDAMIARIIATTIAQMKAERRKKQAKSKGV